MSQDLKPGPAELIMFLLFWGLALLAEILVVAAFFG